MPTRPIHVCECSVCQDQTTSPQRLLHEQINLLVSRLDEQQRRWYVALEAQRVGHGGDKLLSTITGLDEDTIARGRREMSASLQGRPTQSIRVAGGGRPATEKKLPR